MKFAQLPIGSRFRYQGEVWSKTSPLAASGPGGGQRMIARSATVEALDETGAAPPQRPSREQALAAYHQTCSQLLREAAASGPAALDALQRRLDQAHAALVAAID